MLFQPISSNLKIDNADTSGLGAVHPFAQRLLGPGDLAAEDVVDANLFVLVQAALIVSAAVVKTLEGLCCCLLETTVGGKIRLRREL